MKRCDCTATMINVETIMNNEISFELSDKTTAQTYVLFNLYMYVYMLTYSSYSPPYYTFLFLVLLFDNDTRKEKQKKI